MKRIVILPVSLAAVLLATAAMAEEGTQPGDEGIPRLPDQIIVAPLEPEALVTLSYGGYAGVTYNDNIYRSPSDETDDFVALIKPGFNVKSDLERHALEAGGEIEAGLHASENDNDYVDGNLQVNGRYDISPLSWMDAYGRVRYDHVGIGAFVDNPDRSASEPTTYRYVETGADVNYRNGWLLKTGPAFYLYNYDNTERTNGGSIINDDRDHNELSGHIRVGPRVADKTYAYVQGEYGVRNYGNRIDSTLLNSRDSDGYRVLVGAEYGQQKDKQLWVDAGVGYFSQSYDDALYEDVDGLAADARVEWYVRNNVKMIAGLGRSVQETTLAGASGYVRTRLNAGAEYQPNERWRLVGDLRYTNNEFEVNPASGRPDREDDVYEASLLAQYNITEKHNVGLEYLHVTRSSDDPNIEYDSNALILLVGASY